MAEGTDETLEISAITEDEEIRHKIRVDSENFLEHEKQIFTDIVYTDALLVAAKGRVFWYIRIREDLNVARSLEMIDWL